MTDNEIIKALECCVTIGDFTKSQIEICSPCPYDNCGDCTGLLKANALDLINRLQAENERLKGAIKSSKETKQRLRAEIFVKKKLLDIAECCTKTSTP